MASVVIIGVATELGERTLWEALDEGHDVLAVAHDREDLPEAEGLETSGVDLTEDGGVDDVIAEGDVVVLCPVREGPEPLNLEHRIFERVVAESQGVEHLIAMTALQAGRANIGVRLLEHAGQLEEVVRDTGVPYTILRPGLLLDQLFAHQRERQFLELPFPPGHEVGVVPTRDVARAAVQLIDAGPQGRAFDVHLPGGLTGQWMAERMEDLYGRIIAYRQAEDVQAWPQSLNLPEDQHELLAELLAYAAENAYLGDADEIVEALPAFEYRTFETFLRNDLPEGDDAYALPHRPTRAPPSVEREAQDLEEGPQQR